MNPQQIDRHCHTSTIYWMKISIDTVTITRNAEWKHLSNTFHIISYLHSLKGLLYFFLMQIFNSELFNTSGLSIATCNMQSHWIVAHHLFSIQNKYTRDICNIIWRLFWVYRFWRFKRWFCQNKYKIYLNNRVFVTFQIMITIDVENVYDFPINLLI